MSILVVVAHPDDEVLGCGGTIARHAQRGEVVNVAALSDGVSSRALDLDHQGELLRRRAAAQSAAQILGVSSTSFGDLPDNQMDRVPLLEVARLVEELIHRHEPRIIYTHHGGDLNIDHRLTHQAVVTASRPQPKTFVRTVLFFETPSSTEWQSPTNASIFAPAWFIDVSQTLSTKLQALESYRDEMREWPHPRSIEAVTHLARWRGATVGVPAAEAFSVGRHLICG